MYVDNNGQDVTSKFQGGEEPNHPQYYRIILLNYNMENKIIQ